MEHMKQEQEHEHGNERLKSAREILEERLQGMGGGGKGEAGGAADALRKAAEKAPAEGAAAASPAAPPAAEFEALKKKAQERDEYFDQLLRTRADFDNYQKRTRKEMAEYRDFALSGVFNDILLAIDTLDLALHSSGDSKEVAPIRQGVEMVRGQLEKILTDRGATRIATEGNFDPHRHEAVLAEERADVPPGTITGEIRRGYVFKDRVIRAAQVKVSRAPSSAEARGAPGA
jgi:molecular chaperone GrpE